MRHIRDATRSYEPRKTIHMTCENTATLALRLNQFTTPTLLSPFQDYDDNISISTPEFQSNGFLKSPSRCLLAGLGIHFESHILQFSDKNHSNGLYNLNNVTRHDTPPGPAFQPRKSLTCVSDSPSSLAVISDTSLFNPSYPSSSSSASLASTRSASDNEGYQTPKAFSLPYHLADDILSSPPANIGLIPDVNMYNLALLMKQPSVGVDPLDTMGRVSAPPQVPLSPSNSPLPSSKPTNLGSSPLCIADSLPSALCVARESTPPPPSQDCPSSAIIHDIVTILSTSATQEPDEESIKVCYSQQPSIDQHPPQKRAWVSPIIKIQKRSDEPVLYVFSPKQEDGHIPFNSDKFSFPSSDTMFPSRQIKVEGDHLVHNDTFPSPILNAHLGIELAELAFRAQRYRARHPGQEIDRTWLMHFGGKLTDRGELIDDFRCYVVGCDQRNKRRDHIIVHIGAHVDQRPFGCSMCSQRFLRKNECKRHEASHTGARPHRCELCGQTFVRQDLLKRHGKRTHGLEKGGHGSGSRRKKARTG